MEIDNAKLHSIIKLTSKWIVVDRKSAEREVWRRSAMVTECWKSSTSALCEQFFIEHRGCRCGACAWRRRRRLCQKRQHSGCICFRSSTRLYLFIDFARYLWNLSLAPAFVVDPRNRATELALSRSVDATCVALSVTAVNRYATIVSQMYGGVCCVSASNLSTTTCLADDRRGCFLTAAETHLALNTFLTCSELWTCPERRARLLVVVVAIADQSALASGARCRLVGGR